MSQFTLVAKMITVIQATVGALKIHLQYMVVITIGYKKNHL